EQGKIGRVPIEKYKKQAEAICRQIQDRAWNDKIQSYVTDLDGDQVDSSLLLLSWFGFEKADSVKMRSTYRRLRERLSTKDGLLYRSEQLRRDRKSTRLNSSHRTISYAVFCLKKKKKTINNTEIQHKEY